MKIKFRGSTGKSSIPNEQNTHLLWNSNMIRLCKDMGQGWLWVLTLSLSHMLGSRLDLQQWLVNTIYNNFYTIFQLQLCILKTLKLFLQVQLFWSDGLRKFLEYSYLMNLYYCLYDRLWLESKICNVILCIISLAVFHKLC